MIAVQGVKKGSIRKHYQLGTLFYRLLWGPHIHHGLWHGDESASVAQCQLTDTLADLTDIAAGDRMVDVGCGMGGSSIRLLPDGDHSTQYLSLAEASAGSTGFFKSVGGQKCWRLADGIKPSVHLTPGNRIGIERMGLFG